MASSSFATTNSRLYAIADGQHMLAVVEAYWPVLEKYGAAPSDKKALVDRIAKAIVLNDAEDNEQDNGLAEARPELFELVGAFRGSASLVVHGPRATDATAELELKTKGAFPETDKAMLGFWKGMPKMIKKYATQLSQRGFSREDQAKAAREDGAVR